MDVAVVFVAGSSPSARDFVLETVGSDSSSATNGSSVASVAGKKRLPAKPCASAASVAANASAQTSAHEQILVISSSSGDRESGAPSGRKLSAGGCAIERQLRRLEARAREEGKRGVRHAAALRAPRAGNRPGPHRQTRAAAAAGRSPGT